MKVGLFYDKIDGCWTYTGFERQPEASIKTQNDAIDVFLVDGDFDIQEGLYEFYEGNCNALVVYLDISIDGKELLSRKVEIEELPQYEGLFD